MWGEPATPFVPFTLNAAPATRARDLPNATLQAHKTTTKTKHEHQDTRNATPPIKTKFNIGEFGSTPASVRLITLHKHHFSELQASFRVGISTPSTQLNQKWTRRACRKGRIATRKRTSQHDHTVPKDPRPNKKTKILSPELALIPPLRPHNLKSTPEAKKTPLDVLYHEHNSILLLVQHIYNAIKIANMIVFDQITPSRNAQSCKPKRLHNQHPIKKKPRRNQS